MRRACTTKQSAELGEVAGGAAGFKEFAGADEVVVLAAQKQRPRQLQPTLEFLEDLDRRIEVFGRRLLMATPYLLKFDPPQPLSQVLPGTTLVRELGKKQ